MNTKQITKEGIKKNKEYPSKKQCTNQYLHGY